eukprot:Gregarina_sp_Poly_1__11398@NODE_96_length_14647_cov_152_270302_g83_i0_p2_GENE_NODE_96_length_14647_cov_152_270302_g83_i0NODE_96_length_14647_cov_152_270302_g83_i0_p2_ORF_typecomplete_len524_score51_52EGF_MSP1_1/PF12946_7/0_11_NODE_96_length_14647_cov_152_270302_g83_i068868457
MKGLSIVSFALTWNTLISSATEGAYVTELYETCTGEQGYQARCGPGANCFIIGGVPTCHCIVDLTTGLPLAGNPYRACTADLTGKWEAYFSGESGMFRPLSDPFSNEPFVIQIDRTDAILKTQYLTGAIFVVTAITGGAAGVCARAYVDVNDNISVILELAEGFVDISGRNMFFRNRRTDISLWKKYPKKPTPQDSRNLWGGWKKVDGNKVKICEFKHKDHGKFARPTGYSTVVTPTWAYWYNDESFGAPAIRLSTALWLDDTLPFEQAAFETSNRFVQLGWFGLLSIGAGTITIIAPGDGKEIFTLRRLYDFDLPQAVGLPTQTFTLTGVDQIMALKAAAGAALVGNNNKSNFAEFQPMPRLLSANHSANVPSSLYTAPRPRLPSDDDGVFTSWDRLRDMETSNGTGRVLRQTTEFRSIYPDPYNYPHHMTCPRVLASFPKVTLDDLKKFRDLGKPAAPAVENAKPARSPESFMQLDTFFGMEDDSQEGPSTYTLLWSNMASRLSKAQQEAEDKVKMRLKQR